MQHQNARLTIFKIKVHEINEMMILNFSHISVARNSGKCHCTTATNYLLQYCIQVDLIFDIKSKFHELVLQKLLSCLWWCWLKLCAKKECRLSKLCQIQILWNNILEHLFFSSAHHHSNDKPPSNSEPKITHQQRIELIASAAAITEDIKVS